MVDPRFPIPPLPTDEPLASSPITTNWGEVGRSRWGRKLTWRQHLRYFVLMFLMISTGLGLYGFLKWRQIREKGGTGYKLPDYSYLHGHCFHRHKAGVVPDEYCENALYIIDKDGHRRPRFIFDSQKGICYDTLLVTRHEAPTEFCSRKSVPDASSHKQ